MAICVDGLTGIKEAISTAHLEAEYQRCIVHIVRNTLKYVNYKDMKSFTSDLKLSPIHRMRKQHMRTCMKLLINGIANILIL